jgi:hypothetical protein
MIRSLRPAVGGAALAMTVIMGGAILLPGAGAPFRAADAKTPASALHVTGRYRFLVGPDGGRFALGADTLVIPPRAICAPATSGYGAGSWNRPCAVATDPIEVTADVREAPRGGGPAATGEAGSGGRWIEFSPALRFVPTSDSTRWVRLTFRGKPVGPSGAAADTGRVTWRRIRHFSGYQVHAG